MPMLTRVLSRLALARTALTRTRAARALLHSAVPPATPAPTRLAAASAACAAACRRALSSATASAATARAATTGPTALPATMKAQVLRRSGADYDMGLETLQMPVPKAGEVLVRVRATGVCMTDLHIAKAEVAFPVPAVLGHEMSGTVVALADTGLDDSTRARLRVGARCVSPFIMPCGHCPYCVRGREDMCEVFFRLNRGKGQLYDASTRLFRPDGTPVAMYSFGGLAEYCVVPATAVFELPDAIPHAEASILGCALFTAYGAVTHGAAIRPGESVAVLGTGGVGGNALQLLRAFGADPIVAIDVADDKLVKARQLGATHTVNARTVPGGDVAAAVRAVTGGRGVDVAIEALGHPVTFRQTTECVVDGGRCVMVGIAVAGQMGSVEINRLVRRSIRVIGSFGARARQDTPALVELVRRGVVDVASPVTRRYSLADAAKAYADLGAGRITGRAIIDLHL